jgi:hypothetical protein
LSRISHLCLGWSGHTPLIYTSCVAGMTSMCHHTQLLLVEVSLVNFCPSHPQTSILLIYTSWVAGIMGMSHHTQLRSCFWEKKLLVTIFFLILFSPSFMSFFFLVLRIKPRAYVCETSALPQSYILNPWFFETRSYSVAQTHLGDLLPQPPKYWNSRYAAPYLASI